MFSTLVTSLTLASAVLGQSYSATYLPGNAPNKSEQGQSGTNACGNGQDQNSMCQNVYMNSLEDFCLFGPPAPNASVGDDERIMVSWCVMGGHGTRVIPDGTISGAHFVQTPDYVQVTGVGDFTKINVAAGDEGGELDPHGADGNGNPIGGLVFSSAFGSMSQMHEWTNFMSANEFCIRACKDGPGAPKMCQHVYDVMGCYWNMPGDYSASSFDSCHGDSGEPMGVYGTSTFHQGQPTTPTAHPAPAKSQCNAASTIGNGLAVSTTSAAASTTPSVNATTSLSSATPTNSSSSPTIVPQTSNSTTTATTSATNLSGSSSGSSPSPNVAVGSTGTPPPAPGSTSTSGSSSSSSVAPTGAAGNGAASLSGRGLAGMLAVVLAGALAAV